MAQSVQIVADAVGGTLEGLREFDLAAGEGMFSVELAAHGAHVLTIEARARSVAKIEFALDALGLSNMRVLQGDIRELSRDRHASRFQRSWLYGTMQALVPPFLRAARRRELLKRHR